MKPYMYNVKIGDHDGRGIFLEYEDGDNVLPPSTNGASFANVTDALDFLEQRFNNCPYYAQDSQYPRLDDIYTEHFQENIGRFFPGYTPAELNGASTIPLIINGVKVENVNVFVTDNSYTKNGVTYPGQVNAITPESYPTHVPNFFASWYVRVNGAQWWYGGGYHLNTPFSSIAFSICIFQKDSVVNGKIMQGSKYNIYEVELQCRKSGDYNYYAITRAQGLNTFNDTRFNDVEFIPYSPDNPYEPGGTSGEGDLPPGTFDDASDAIPLPPIPTLSAANTGFTRIYNPTLSQVQALARYLWTDETVIQTIWNHIKQYFEDPMQAIIGFNLVPVTVPDGGTQNFALMYIDTGVSMTVAANQFVDVDCGSLSLERYYGSALDQSPYTKVHCFLPFIGTVQLDTDEVMGTTLSVNYRVDIVSGSCVASILVDGNVLYQYSGHCAITIPFSSADFSNYVSAAIQVGKLIGMSAAGGIGAAIAGAVEDPQQETGNTLTTTIETVNTARNPATGRQVTTGTTRQVISAEQPQRQSQTKASFAGLSPANVANTVGQVISSKPVIQRSGSFSGNSGYLGVRRPYLIIQRPRMCLPADYQTLNGYPAMITMVLGECKGYTRVQQVQLTGLAATNPEQAEILELLKSGVVF